MFKKLFGSQPHAESRTASREAQTGGKKQIDWLASQLRDQKYVADSDLLSSLYLMDSLAKPLLLEGDAGVGKTEVARCLAAAHDTQLLRLQCYEGLNAHQALYDWDYPRQLLAIQMTSEDQRSGLKKSIYSEEYLLKRPLLSAITATKPAVLLIDEIDRADEEFEALLLELLSDFQVSIPEMGTVKAKSIPKVILTSNGVRELSDALKRRCLYHYIDFPDFSKELEIIETRLPHIDRTLANQLVSFVQSLRDENLRKTPGIAESIDWAMALMDLGVKSLNDDDKSIIMQSLSCLLKTQEDVTLVKEKFSDLLDLKSGSVTN